LSDEFREQYGEKIKRIYNETDILTDEEVYFFPGVISDFANQDQRKGKNLPPMLHLFCDVILKRELELAGFEIEFLEYLDRRKDFPEFLWLDGRESIGAIAKKGVEVSALF